MKMVFLVLLLIGVPSASFSEEGAGDVLEALGGSLKTTLPEDLKENSAADASADDNSQEIIVSNDSMVRHFWVESRSQKMSFDVHAWSQRFVRGKYRDVVHLWSVVRDQIPEDFRTTAEAAYVYSLYKVGLTQGFLEAWIGLLEKPGFTQTVTGKTLAAILGEKMEGFLYSHALHFNDRSRGIIEALPPTKEPAYLNLKAAAFLRDGVAALTLLPKLAPENLFMIPLAHSAIVSLTKKGDLVEAARVMKSYLEPALKARKYSGIIQHYVHVARLLYQSGQLDGAEKYYEKVPGGASEYLTAREELMWVLLRKGNVSKLRGQLEDLSSPLFKEKFLPEMRVVKAISNLKLCHYDSAQSDIDSFRVEQKSWAQKIDAALSSSETPRPANADFYTERTEKTVKTLARELKAVEELGQDSIRAALPAVGVQQHWKDMLAELKRTYELSRKDQSTEYRRQWKFMMTSLTEAIRKMRFVRIEFLNQVREQTKLSQLSESQQAAVGGTDVSGAAVLTVNAKEMSYPFEGVVWPDEFFKLRSTAQMRCRQ